MKAHVLAATLAVALLSACAGLGLSGSGPLHIEVPALTGARPLARAGQPLRVRVEPFADARGTPSRKIGNIRATIRDMHGTELQADRDIDAFVTEVTRAQLAADGLQLVAPGGDADLAVQGVVKDFALDIAGRDERRIKVEVTLRDGRSGKVLWAGAIAERDDRYAGVAGNSRASISDYLAEGVATYTERLSAALREALTKIYPDAVEAARPASHTAVPGVTTLQAPMVQAPPPAPNIAPVVAPVAPQAVEPRPATAAGYFVVQTVPPRARVYVGDVYHGMTPLRLELPPGVATISLKLGGYRNVTEKVAIRAGQTTELELPLEKQ